MIGIKPIQDKILVGIYDDGDTTIMLGGKKFFLLDDSSATQKRDIHTKHQGVRPRWAIVLAVPDSEDSYGDIKVGDKVYLDQLKWSRGVTAPVNGDSKTVWSIPAEDILLTGDQRISPKKINCKSLDCTPIGNHGL